MFPWISISFPEHDHYIRCMYYLKRLYRNPSKKIGFFSEKEKWDLLYNRKMLIKEIYYGNKCSMESMYYESNPVKVSRLIPDKEIFLINFFLHLNSLFDMHRWIIFLLRCLTSTSLISGNNEPIYFTKLRPSFSNAISHLLRNTDIDFLVCKTLSADAALVRGGFLLGDCTEFSVTFPKIKL